MNIFHIFFVLGCIGVIYVNVTCIRANAWATLIFVDVIAFIQLKFIFDIIMLSPVDF